MAPLIPVYRHLRMLAYATVFAVEDLALIAVLPLLEHLMNSGRLDALIQNRLLLKQAEDACKESV